MTTSDHLSPEDLQRIWEGAGEPARRLLRFFAYDHLPLPLQDVSRHFHALAWTMAGMIPHNAEHTVGLRKLLEAKDCYVRAMLPGGPP